MWWIFFCSRATQLCPGGVIIPGKVRLKAVLISSPALRAQSCVLGTIPTLGFEVAPVINRYQVTHFVDVDLSAYPLQLLSREALLMEVDLNSLAREPLKVKFAAMVLEPRNVAPVERGQPLYKEQNGWSPSCPLFRGSTVIMSLIKL